MSEEALIIGKNVDFTYTIKSGLGRNKLTKPIKGANFIINRGVKIGLIGANGAGKSTFLKLLASIFEPTDGRIKRKAGLSCKLLSIASSLDMSLNGRDNAKLFLALERVNRNDRKELIELIKKTSDIGDFFEQPVKYYSTGMRARLSFAFCSLVATDVILIDELMGVGDASFRTKATELMRRRINSGAAAVIASHQTDYLKAVADEIWVLNDGNLLTNMNKEDAVKYYLGYKNSVVSHTRLL